MLRVFLVLAVLLVAPPTTFSDTINVPADYATIQFAIDAAANGDVVLVARGTYVENIDFIGKAITVKSSEGPKKTIIDGNNAGSCVKFTKGEGSDSVLNGFTLTNGSGTVNPFDHKSGGGIYCINNSSPQINNSTIINNEAVFGGGVYCYKYSSPIFKSCSVNNNIGHTGGGFYCEKQCHMEILNTTISNNIANGSNGGGLHINNSSPVFVNTLITYNNAYHEGAGIACFSCFSDIINCNIIGNKTKYGGGIDCRDNSNLCIVNTILWDNEASLYGNEIYISGATVDVRYSDIKGGKDGVYYQTGSLIWGDGMIDTDPLFVNPGSRDYHVLIGSDCIDSGDDSIVGLPEFDFEDDPRIAYGTVDIGVDEFFPHLYYTGNASPGGSVEGKIIGLPWTTPVSLFFGSGVHETPLNTMYGDWWLQLPIVVIPGLGPVPMDGIIKIPGTIPAAPLPEYFMQAFIGDMLSNLCVIEVL